MALYQQNWPTAAPPMSIQDHYWVYASCPTRQRRGGRSGKWLLFVDRRRADETWERIAQATAGGRLGPVSKCGTARPNLSARDRRTTVICVYTYDYNDRNDVMRVREELRGLGFAKRIPYKLDSVTRAGRYSTDSGRSVASLWA
jgi:hypothetical protein